MKKFNLIIVMMFLTSIANAVTVNVYQKDQPLQVNICRYNTDTQEINCPALEYKDKIVLGVNFYNMTETQFNYQFDIKFKGLTTKYNESYKFVYKDICEVYDDFGLWIRCSKMELVDNFCTINASIKFTDINIFFDVNINKWIVQKPFIFNYGHYNHLGIFYSAINNIGNSSNSSSSSNSGSISDAYSSSNSNSNATINIFNTQVPIQLPEEPLPPIKPIIEVDKSKTKIIDNGPSIIHTNTNGNKDSNIKVDVTSSNNGNSNNSQNGSSSSSNSSSNKDKTNNGKNNKE